MKETQKALGWLHFVWPILEAIFMQTQNKPEVAIEVLEETYRAITERNKRELQELKKRKKKSS